MARWPRTPPRCGRQDQPLADSSQPAALLPLGLRQPLNRSLVLGTQLTKPSTIAQCLLDRRDITSEGERLLLRLCPLPHRQISQTLDRTRTSGIRSMPGRRKVPPLA
jgi:hypothetical protein